MTGNSLRIIFKRIKFYMRFLRLTYTYILFIMFLQWKIEKRGEMQ